MSLSALSLLVVVGVDSRLPIPSWMKTTRADHLGYLQASHNFSIENIPRFASDMYATGVGHALAYESLVTKGKDLETKLHATIMRVLKNPPRINVDEAAISPAFNRRFGNLEKVFDWAHNLHFQTIDVLCSTRLTQAQKDKEIERLWAFYTSEPYAITGNPMNMEYLDSFAWSGKFRRTYPKLNALFWGYHWLQTVNYDMLFQTTLADQRAQYSVLGEQYLNVELVRTDRDFMPMTAEMSPRFSARFPQVANSFDNLHMLHDNVNDILADVSLSPAQQDTEIEQAIVRVLHSTHAKYKPGENYGLAEVPNLRDYRHPPSMPGMGMMKGADEDQMYMSGMGWMDISECAHCSTRLPSGPDWGASVTANGWTMRVRCIMCARDMASETPGRAIIRSATEDPTQTLVLISDEEGNWTSSHPGVVFLEEFGDHLHCNSWSKAFTSLAGLKRYQASHPQHAKMTPLTLSEWSKLNHGTPDTYRKIDRPNPYKK